MQSLNTKRLVYKAPGSFEETRYEKLHNVISESPNEGSKLIAQEIAYLITEKQKQNKMCVLGLATGSSPVSVYRELVRMHQEEGLSFKNVISFNLDEYYPLSKEDVQSYHYFMHTHLFNYVDIVFLPLALRLAISCLPAFVAILDLNPCLLFLTRLLGW